jgi:hypothetical protein
MVNRVTSKGSFAASRAARANAKRQARSAPGAPVEASECAAFNLRLITVSDDVISAPALLTISGYRRALTNCLSRLETLSKMQCIFHISAPG